MSDIEVALPEPTKPRPARKPFPFHDGGVSENAAFRVIRVVKPECPIDASPELKQRDGSYRPNPRYTGEINCQQAFKVNQQGVWDIEKCESLGHDPWHTVFRKTLVDDVVDENGVVTDQKTKIIIEKRLNIIQVSLSKRHTSGTELLLAQARGALTLEEYGERFPDELYENPCQFRSCTQRPTLHTRWGDFCSERHARLVAAAERDVMTFVRNDKDPHQGGQDKLQFEYLQQVEGIPLGSEAM